MGIKQSTSKAKKLRVAEECKDNGQLKQAKVIKMDIIQQERRFLGQLNKNYLKTGSNNYEINGVFKANDVILPSDYTEKNQCLDLILNMTKVNPYECHSPIMEQECTSTNSGTPPSRLSQISIQSKSNMLIIDQIQVKSKLTDYTQIMMDRWKATCCKDLPKLDYEDSMKLADSSTRECDQGQGQPEYAQSNYIRMRSIEEAYCIYNYFDPALNKGYQIKKKNTNVKHLQPSDRSHIMQFMNQLQKSRNYSYDTLETSAIIFDQYVALTGPQNIMKANITTLATTCLLMGAKLSQPIQPRCENMINAVKNMNGEKVKKYDVLNQEEKIIRKLQFDMIFSGPKLFLDRYLRLLEYDDNKKVKENAIQILTNYLVDDTLLKFKPSVIAACTAILSINIYNAQKEIKEGTLDSKDSFFKNSQLEVLKKTKSSKTLRQQQIQNLNNYKADLKVRLNTEIWNNVRISGETGYTIEMLKDCLYCLCKFIEDYLVPNKVKYFDIQSIKTLHNCLYYQQYNDLEKQ